MPPVIPGPEPDPTIQQPPAQPAYQQPAHQAPPTVPVAKVAGSTVVVIAVLIGVLCVLPALICGGIAVLGNIGK